MSTYTPNFHGVDRRIVDAAIAKGRRERNAALRAMVSSIFPSIADKRETEATHAEVDLASTNGARPMHL
ncbi:MAG: hypothetical protein ACKVP7_23900 [Hyphomicrobiaceae bacterium]